LERSRKGSRSKRSNARREGNKARAVILQVQAMPTATPKPSQAAKEGRAWSHRWRRTQARKRNAVGTSFFTAVDQARKVGSRAQRKSAEPQRAGPPVRVARKRSQPSASPNSKVTERAAPNIRPAWSWLRMKQKRWARFCSSMPRGGACKGSESKGKACKAMQKGGWLKVFSWRTSPWVQYA
jgi:hypothetical protein